MVEKTAIVTGCNRGLGRGIAEMLLQDGYRVYGLNRTDDDPIGHHGYVSVICDVSSLNQVEKAHSEIFPCGDVRMPYPKDRIDVLVCNAGIRRFSSVSLMNPEDWKQSVDINLTGVFNVTRTFLPSVTEAEGNIVIIGSHSEKYTFEEGAAYCSTKGALRQFSECIMHETRYSGVRTTYLSLGSIHNRNHGGDESWKMQPQEVGEAVLSIVKLPKHIMMPYADIRPSMPLKSEQSGIERLQYV